MVFRDWHAVREHQCLDLFYQLSILQFLSRWEVAGKSLGKRASWYEIWSVPALVPLLVVQAITCWHSRSRPSTQSACSNLVVRLLNYSCVWPIIAPFLPNRVVRFLSFCLELFEVTSPLTVVLCWVPRRLAWSRCGNCDLLFAIVLYRNYYCNIDKGSILFWNSHTITRVLLWAKNCLTYVNQLNL